MRRHAIFRAMTNGTNQQIQAFQTAEGPFHLRQTLVTTHRIGGRQLFRRLIGANAILPQVSLWEELTGHAAAWQRSPIVPDGGSQRRQRLVKHDPLYRSCSTYSFLPLASLHRQDMCLCASHGLIMRKL